MGYNTKVNHHAYAVKFFADQRDVADLSDEALKKAFAGCVFPAKEREYPVIRLYIAIEQVSNILSDAVNGVSDRLPALLAQESIIQGALHRMEIIAGETVDRLPSPSTDYAK